MRAFGYVIMTMLGLLALAGAAGAAEPSPNDPGPHLVIRLVAETMQPTAGSEVTLALDTTPQP
eukprot:gene59535-81479_t